MSVHTSVASSSSPPPPVASDVGRLPAVTSLEKRMASWEEHVRNFLLEEEKEDDELLFILLILCSLDELDVLSEHNEDNNEAQSAPPNQDCVLGASCGEKRKQSHIGSVIEDYVEFKKRQTRKMMEALNQKKRQDEEFSVQKCLDEMDSMVGLTDEEKAYTMDIFKTEINRELFMKTKNQNVRFIWLKRRIRALGGSSMI